MIKKDDAKAIREIDTKWNNFLTARGRKNYELKPTGKHWLTMLQRESYISQLLKIIKKYEVYDSVTYDLSR